MPWLRWSPGSCFPKRTIAARRALASSLTVGRLLLRLVRAAYGTALSFRVFSRFWCAQKSAQTGSFIVFHASPYISNSSNDENDSFRTDERAGASELRFIAAFFCQTWSTGLSAVKISACVALRNGGMNIVHTAPRASTGWQSSTPPNRESKGSLLI